MENLTPINITRVKCVSDKNGTAYMDLKEGIHILHFPDKQKNNILDTATDEIIAVFQKIDGVSYFTHLMIPTQDIQAPPTYDGRENYKFGRYVQIIAATGDYNKINLKNTKIGRKSFLNRAWGRSEKISDIAQNEDIEEYQNDLWERFKPYFSTILKSADLIFKTCLSEIEIQSESLEGFSAEEGKEIYLANHLIRERNSQIVKQKKQLAEAENLLFCEVCNFSFLNSYGQSFIECHHKDPILNGVRKTYMKDLALVCSNCHRMLHRKFNNRYISIDELKVVVFDNKNLK